MSFILDALRKSENARLRQEHPAMFDARPAPTRRRFPAWFLALGLLLGLNLLVLLYVLLRGERSAIAAPPATTVTAPAMASAPPPATMPAPMPAAPAGTPPMTPIPSAPSAASSGPTTPVGTASSNVAPAAPVAVPPARTRDDLLAAGGAVPEVQVSLHVYDADPAKRFVFLNGQRLREGDVAADGLRVERIEADGVVLDHRGSAFKVPLEP
ncbi:MAG: hypothetical protein EBS39_03210 [Gammaproteobacteria bacterium]|nr:hypothetical protein [Gammaproteobacteria bacterium]